MDRLTTDRLEILESDHAALGAVLDAFTKTANRAIQPDQRQAHGGAGKLHALARTIKAFLKRHPGDEEDLAVPIILHHRLRG